MIDLHKIMEDAQIESVQSIFNGAVGNPEKDAIKSYVNVYKALMKYSITLLESYHEALQKELAEHGIDI